MNTEEIIMRIIYQVIVIIHSYLSDMMQVVMNRANLILHLMTSLSSKFWNADAASAHSLYHSGEIPPIVSSQ